MVSHDYRPVHKVLLDVRLRVPYLPRGDVVLGNHLGHDSRLAIFSGEVFS